MKIKIERRNGNGGNKMNGNIIKKEDFERELGEEKKEEKKWKKGKLIEERKKRKWKLKIKEGIMDKG